MKRAEHLSGDSPVAADPGGDECNDGPRPVPQRFGLTLVLLGGALGVVWLLDVVEPLPVAMPRTWHLHRTVWGVGGWAVAVLGWWLQRDRRPPSAPAARQSRRGWSAQTPGRRFREVVVFSRDGCHLCDDVKELLGEYSEYLPESIEVDVDTSEVLRERYGTAVPVVQIDGRDRFRGRIDESLLRRLIDATPPLEEG